MLGRKIFITFNTDRDLLGLWASGSVGTGFRSVFYVFIFGYVY